MFISLQPDFFHWALGWLSVNWLVVEVTKAIGLYNTVAEPSTGLIARWDRPGKLPEILVRTGTHDHPPLYEGVRCLWHAGVIANHLEMIRQCQLPSDIPDHQLLLACYKRFGNQTPAYIEGTFAFVLWDSNLQVLLIVRDRIGLHSLYYTILGQEVSIADRADLLVPNSPSPNDINTTSVVAYFHGQAPLPAQTFYQDVCAVEPGGFLVIYRDYVELGSYWKIEPKRTLKLASDSQYAGALRELLFQVVAEYAPSRHLGVTLSGGMDSTCLAAAVCATEPQTRPLTIRWITPELPEADESRYSLAVSHYLGLSTVVVRADLHWPLCSPGMRTRPSSPFCPYYGTLWDEVFRVARENEIDTLFTGAGGDHLFGDDVFAYPDLLLTGRWAELMRQLRVHVPYSKIGLAGIVRIMIIRPILDAYFPQLSHPSRSPEPWLGDTYRDLYRDRLAPSTKQCKQRLLPGQVQRLRLIDVPRISQLLEPFGMQAKEYGIELRHPLLDRRLIEFALTLPTSQTFVAAMRKVILRRAMQGYLPREVLDFRDKISLTPVFKRGMQREQAQVWNLLTDMRAADLGFVDEACLRETFRDYLDGKHHKSRFWHALTLEDWLRRYF